MRSVVVALAMCAAMPASAEDGATERVTVKLAGTDAVFAVRHVLRLPEPTLTSGFQIALPMRSSVTSALADGHRLALVPAKSASAAFEALQGQSEGPAPRSAIGIHAMQNGVVTLDVAIPHATALTLDLGVSAPTCYANDTRFVEVPASWRSILVGARVVPAATVADACTSSSFGTSTIWVALASRELAKRPGGIDRVGGVASRIVLGHKHVAKIELDLAARISEVPADLATVILVDASRSMSQEQRDGQRTLVASYLRGAPRSAVQVIAYDRKARPLLPAWTMAAQAAVRIERELRALAPRNGSNVEVGLREAAAWLARTRGTHRVIIFGDERLPDRFTARAIRELRPLLPAGTLVHVAELADGAARALARIGVDAELRLAPLARSTGGIAVTGAGPTLDAAMLVRPITLDNVVMKAPGWTRLDVDIAQTCGGSREDPRIMAEGMGCSWFGEGTAVSGPIVFEGELWGERVVRVLRPDAGRARTLARELSGFAVTLGATDAERTQLTAAIDRAAYAVNSEWALYGEWGGRDGHEAQGGFGFGRSGFGSSCCGDHVRVPPIVRIGHPATAATIPEQLQAAIDTCKPDRDVFVEAEITSEEIVGVEVTTEAAPLRACVEEAVWNTWLVAPNAPQHAKIGARR